MFHAASGVATLRKKMTSRERLATQNSQSQLTYTAWAMHDSQADRTAKQAISCEYGKCWMPSNEIVDALRIAIFNEKAEQHDLEPSL
jgi:hypothetical protein